MEVDRLEQVAEGVRVAGGRRGEEAHRADRPLLVVAHAGQRRKPQQAVGGG